MIRTQIQLTDEQMERLRSAAERAHVSIAEIIRRAVDEVVGRREARAEDLQRRARELAGKFGSGRDDVSSSHDEHLANAFRE